MNAAYYNEFDPHAAQWLRELISAGLIMDGEVDERSIFDVEPKDLDGFIRCHFFAGVAGWEVALQIAGWPTTRPVWTGSCPCQPFSVAGKGKGTADERHLWPEFFRLIRECRPDTIFGEQVCSADVVGKIGGKSKKPDQPVWFDGVYTDLEAAHYTVGACDLPAAGFGAPHIRQRLFWVADSGNTKRGEVCVNRKDGCNRENCGRQETHGELGTCREVFGLADGQEHGRRKGHPEKRRSLSGIDAPEERARPERDCPDCGVGNAQGGKKRRERQPRPGHGQNGTDRGPGLFGCGMGITNGTGSQPGSQSAKAPGHGRSVESAGWSDSVFISCRDGKYRRVPAQSVVRGVVDGLLEGLDGMRPDDGFPIAAKIKGSKHLLKGYGNAISPQVAAEFIKAFMEVEAL